MAQPAPSHLVVNVHACDGFRPLYLDRRVTCCSSAEFAEPETPLLPSVMLRDLSSVPEESDIGVSPNRKRIWPIVFL